MVSYQAWVSVVFDRAKKGGATYSGLEDGAQTVDVAAEIWNDRKAELSTATKAEARDIAKSEISIQ